MSSAHMLFQTHMAFSFLEQKKNIILSIERQLFWTPLTFIVWAIFYCVF